MAKRLARERSRNGTAAATGGASEGCQICGGPILVEDLHREDRYPRRLCCPVCDAEYGTTRPAARNY